MSEINIVTGCDSRNVMLVPYFFIKLEYGIINRDKEGKSQVGQGEMS